MSKTMSHVNITVNQVKVRVLEIAYIFLSHWPEMSHYLPNIAGYFQGC